MSQEEILALFAELKVLLSDMDVPVFRKTSVHWLSRNLAARNSSHVNYARAAEVIEKLRAGGIATEPQCEQPL